MKVLLCNDDGVHSPGLICLADSLKSITDVVVVAPDRNRSAASHSLTLDRPLRCQKMENEFYSVTGTPTDCVHLAITGLLEEEPSMLVSGINLGANLGDDVLYSGTVAAAMEGRFLGFPAIALSLVGDELKHFSAAAEVAKRLVALMSENPLPSNTILNVNIPDLPYSEIKGSKVTRLGFRHLSEPVIPGRDPRGHKIYWIGAAGPEQDAGPGTDFHAVKQGYVSITPLQVDMTAHAELEPLETWTNNLL